MKIKITYIRSGVAFFIVQGYPDIDEDFFPVGCVMASLLEYAEINPRKDLDWVDFSVNDYYTKEDLEKRYCFCDERTKVLDWDNSKEVELTEDEMDILDKVMLKPIN